MTKALIRHRLDEEAQRLKPFYEARKIAHDPRTDLFAVADLDGELSERFSLPRVTEKTTVFVFTGEGQLVAGWTGVPAAGALQEALTAAEMRSR